MQGANMMSGIPSDSVGVPPNGVLLVSANPADHEVLTGIFGGGRWEFQGAWTMRSAAETIRRHHREIAVAICEERLPDGDWRFLLEAIEKASARSSLIVSSRLGDERLWAEVLNLGGFDLLMGSPFEPEEVLRVVEGAWSAWNRAAWRSAPPRMGPKTERGAVPHAVPQMVQAAAEAGNI
jgi:DNA-binding NtrC family response regulator